ncbi:hypothetical protein GCM10020367_26960 [Streptomyces sannanensis]|uniref:DUF397 domain-containing protein n=1 Tax=Streptomyces sannanensis TaxID=285536 RepID=A0ABP6SAZ7_9ACTN
MTDRVSTRVEMPAATAWRKSSYSGGEGNECVEVARVEDMVAVRDSMNPQGPVIVLPICVFTSFLDEVCAVGSRSL